MIKYSIVITTKNRLQDLKFTLQSLGSMVDRRDVELIICDDASTDGTSDYLKKKFNKYTIITNSNSKGLIYNRNVLNNKAKGEYIISLDDDANFLSNNNLEEIDIYFKKHTNCAVISFRIFWGLLRPNSTSTLEHSLIVNSFVGCGHVWRKKMWHMIPNYPSWFIFYGEENYASLHLFKNNFEVHYNPNILVHHRVDIKKRKSQKDYSLRLRRSLRSGWYLYFLFYPAKEIPRRFVYTLWIQFKTKTLKADLKATAAILRALFDVVYNYRKIKKNRSKLTDKQLTEYLKLPEAVIYWKPKEIETN
ncbi:glycosyltransferase family 2 protein [Polaribacter sp. WD7]|uniref:glycosyltransferase family 2 protein n=1 Tax=Polaribacter sp. WD7 TaxID=2269061 RepID=UPI002163F235|nr:glycosyltransferase family A protein [Polaribacter sp. WD7]